MSTDALLSPSYVAVRRHQLVRPRALEAARALVRSAFPLAAGTERQRLIEDVLQGRLLVARRTDHAESDAAPVLDLASAGSREG